MDSRFSFSKRRLGGVLLVGMMALRFLSASLPALAIEPKLDEETLSLANKTMRNIYENIMAVKGKYQELENFSEKCLTKNKVGIFEIVYENKNYQNPRGDFYRLALTINPISDRAYKVMNGENISSPFSALGLKFEGYQVLRIRGIRFDLKQIIKRHEDILYSYQQQFIPLRLSLKSNKNEYKVGERILFTVILENSGSQNLKVKRLGELSLQFTIENKVWGTTPEASADNNEASVILFPKNSIQRGFTGESFKVPQEVEIRGNYNMAYNGVLPTGFLKIKIVNPPPPAK